MDKEYVTKMNKKLQGGTIGILLSKREKISLVHTCILDTPVLWLSDDSSCLVSAYAILYQMFLQATGCLFGFSLSQDKGERMFKRS